MKSNTYTDEARFTVQVGSRPQALPKAGYFEGSWATRSAFHAFIHSQSIAPSRRWPTRLPRSSRYQATFRAFDARGRSTGHDGEWYRHSTGHAGRRLAVDEYCRPICSGSEREPKRHCAVAPKDSLIVNINTLEAVKMLCDES